MTDDDRKRLVDIKRRMADTTLKWNILYAQQDLSFAVGLVEKLDGEIARMGRPEEPLSEPGTISSLTLPLDASGVGE